MVASGSALTGAYLAMNAAATMLAGFGLLQNSPAVIIGAMLIAMLFGPLVGIALGLAEANLSLLGRSLLGENRGRCMGAGHRLFGWHGESQPLNGQRDSLAHVAEHP